MSRPTQPPLNPGLTLRADFALRRPRAGVKAAFAFPTVLLPVFLTALLLAPSATAEEEPDDPSASATTRPRAEEALPFDREIINRYSLDHLPRSLSIRQGKDLWLGYDLERGKLYKAWRAPADQPGLVASEFVTRSRGTTWYEDKSAETWQLQRNGKAVPLAIRYLGCSQREGHFELSWELRHEAGALTLVERIPMAAAPDEDRAVRELRAESLAADEALLLPLPAREPWKLTHQGRSVPALTGSEWHRLTLP